MLALRMCREHIVRMCINCLTIFDAVNCFFLLFQFELWIPHTTFQLYTNFGLGLISFSFHPFLQLSLGIFVEWESHCDRISCYFGSIEFPLNIIIETICCQQNFIDRILGVDGNVWVSHYHAEQCGVVGDLDSRFCHIQICWWWSKENSLFLSLSTHSALVHNHTKHCWEIKGNGKNTFSSFYLNKFEFVNDWCSVFWRPCRRPKSFHVDRDMKIPIIFVPSFHLSNRGKKRQNSKIPRIVIDRIRTLRTYFLLRCGGVDEAN